MDDERGHDDFRALCMAIGFVVSHTALIDQQLDIWVNASFNNCGGRVLTDDGFVPRALGRKVTFMRKSFKQLELLSFFATEGLALLARVTPLFKTRDDLVHGALTSFETIEGAFLFRIIGHREDVHTVREFSFDPAGFSTLETGLGELLTEAIALSQKLGDALLGC